MTAHTVSMEGKPRPPLGPDGRFGGNKHFRRTLLWVLAIAVIWGFVDVRKRGYLYPENPRKHKTDVSVYTEAGAAFFDGREPYEIANPRGWKYVYPPMFALLMAPLYGLPSQDQVVVWFFISLLVCWGLYRECVQLLALLCQRDRGMAGRYARWFPWLGITALVAALIPTLNCLQRGQVGVLKLYLLLLGARLVLGGRSYWALLGGGVAMAATVVLKIVPALPVAFFLFVLLVAVVKRRWVDGKAQSPVARPLAGATAGFALGMLLFVLLIPGAVLGFKTNLGYLKTWSNIVLTKADHVGMDRFSGNAQTFRNQSLNNAAYKLGNFLDHVFADGPDDRLADQAWELPDPPPMAMDSSLAKTVLLWARLTILLALAAIGIRLGAAGDWLSLATALGLGCVAMLVVSPVSRGHYYMFFVPAMLTLPLWLDLRGLRRAGKIMAVVPAVLTVTHYLFLPHVGRVGFLGLATTAWLIAAMVLVEVASQHRRTVLLHRAVSSGTETLARKAA